MQFHQNSYNFDDIWWNFINNVSMTIGFCMNFHQLLRVMPKFLMKFRQNLIFPVPFMHFSKVCQGLTFAMLMKFHQNGMNFHQNWWKFIQFCWHSFVKISRIVSIIWMDQRLTSTILMKFHQKKWWNFIKNPRATPTILKKFHLNLWKFRYLTLGGGSSSQPTPRPPTKIN